MHALTRFKEPLIVARTSKQHIPASSAQLQQQKQRAYTHTLAHARIQSQIATHSSSVERCATHTPYTLSSSDKPTLSSSDKPTISLSNKPTTLSFAQHTSSTSQIDKQISSIQSVDTYADDLFDNINSALVKENRQIRNSTAKGPILERHNFERDIRIKVTNNSRPITVVERQIVESFGKKEEEQASNNTRIISLHNKNVPEGVQLAIAVDSKKYYSKNALKKITRNLTKNL